MGRKYYCDYCDRSFIDDLEARRKHIFGSMHMRLRKEHYDQFRDPETILAEESAKVPCKRFHNTGECVFGSNCRFSHYSSQDLMTLQYAVQNAEQEKQKSFSKSDERSGESILESWLREKKAPVIPKAFELPTLWELPPELRWRTDLPPSLQPMTETDLAAVEFNSWG